MSRLRPDDLRDLLRVPFTTEQLRSATAPLDPAVIVAGAGSGKTAVMAARVVWLVVTGQVRPSAVLGLTFTNKAAGELSTRIRGALAAAASGSPRVGGTVSQDDGEPVVATYHAYAGRLITDHGLRLGIEPQARLLTEAHRFQLATQVLRRHRGRIEALTSSVDMVAAALVELEAELNEHLVAPERLRDFDERWLGVLEAEAASASAGGGNRLAGQKALADMRATAARRLELVGLVDHYRAAKRELEVVDFGDQVALGARLAEECAAVGAAERAAAQIVLLDEYQDTSVAQRRMLTALFGCGHPVTAVGDPCQAIYGWRGASVANIDGFPEHFRRRDGRPARVFELSVNQRSGGRLLRLANTVAGALRERHRVVELQAPPAVADRGETEVALHPSWDAEVRWLAGRLREVVDEGTSPGECAVLVRARSDIPALHAALLEASLPVEVVGLGGLLALPEVADVVATLRVIDDPTANASLVRLLTGPRWRIGARDLAALGRRATDMLGGDIATLAASAHGQPDESRARAGSALTEPTRLEAAVAGVDPAEVVSLSDALDPVGLATDSDISEEGRRRMTLLGAELAALRRHAADPLVDLVHRVVETIGLDVELSASPEVVAARRRDNLSAFLDVAAEFTGLDADAGLAAFLAYLAAAERYERGLDAGTASGSNAVQLLTIHKAKGLEWDVVAVPDMSRSVFPPGKAGGRWPTNAEVLPASLRGDAAALPDCSGPGRSELARYKEACADHDKREERRLAYVAVTRAKTMLLASGHWWGPTQKRPRGPSPFLEELRDSYAAGHGTVVSWAPEPVEKANPALDDGRAFPWPAPVDESARQQREEAAGLVRAAMRDLATGQGGLGDDAAAMTGPERMLLAGLDRDMELLLAELSRELCPVVDVPLPAVLTASQLVRLRADPDGLARDMARPMPRRPTPAAVRGTRFHMWVEALYRQRPLLDPEDLPGAEDDEVVSGADLVTLQEAFLAGPYGTRVPHAVEVGFSVIVGERAVEGRIDAVYDLGDGRWEVVDWKTGQEPADPVQLAVYRLAWAQLAGVPVDDVEAAFLYVRQHRVERPALLGESDLARVLAGGARVLVGDASPLAGRRADAGRRRAPTGLAVPEGGGCQSPPAATTPRCRCLHRRHRGR